MYMLDERKEKVITMMMEGNGITETAKIVGIARQTIYDWMELEEFKEELDKRRRDIVSKANNMILNKLTTCTDELIKIATEGKSEKVRSDTAAYLIDRILGKTTTKIETNVEQDNSNNVSKDILKDVFSENEQDKQP